MIGPPKLPQNLVLTAVLSGGLTIGCSLAYIVLSALALLFRYNCYAASLDDASGAAYFWITIYRTYILDDECVNSIVNDNLTREHTVFVLSIIILCISALCLVTAITLITVVHDEESARYLNLVVFFYIGSCTASLVVDLTAGAHFGLDFMHLSSTMVESTPGSSSNYETEVIRQGAFLLMAISLKGYIAPLANLILFIMLIVYVCKHHKATKNDEHSIHKLGALNAFDQQRRPEDNNWTRSQPDMYSQDSRRSHVNNGFRADDELPRTPVRDSRELERSDYYSNSFDRSDSWHHTQPPPGHNARPFSYLEDIKRPVPTKPPASPAASSPWNRDPWPSSPPVPVPAPDYSPQAGRRLKSALKPAYM